ncbi:MAG: trypsin-like peptidase domain-containing protein [Elusimicrobia bacterium]|nr:trypsin-like peptidase domain-containing protein [Elusimicrobiota bacterium]
MRPTGLVVTNSHVVEVACEVLDLARAFGREPEVHLTLTDGTPLKATIKACGNPKRLDLAFLQIEGDRADWPTLALRRGDPQIGETVIALGYPMNIGFTATEGIISGVDRSQFGDYALHHQTDAAINPGNSGGPLIDLDGRVVGVDTLKLVGTENMGFAITADTVLFALAKYDRKKTLDSGSIGVDLAVSDGHVVVYHVDPDGPADKAGLKRGDRITAVNGQALSGDPKEAIHQIGRAIKAAAPGETISLSVVRGGEFLDVHIDVGQDGDAVPTYHTYRPRGALAISPARPWAGVALEIDRELQAAGRALSTGR